MTVLPLIYGDLSAQNFTWLNGATGRSNGSGITVSGNGTTYTTGGFGLGQASDAAFPTGNLATAITPPASVTSGSEDNIGFVAKYNTETGDPIQVGYITIHPGSLDGWQCSVNNYDEVHPERIAVTSNGLIYVIGVYVGCNIDLHDPQGNVVVTTNSVSSSLNTQKVFIAVFDTLLMPQACHIVYGKNGNVLDSLRAADIKRAFVGGGPDPLVEKIFFAIDIRDEELHMETFGVGLPPLPAAAPMPLSHPNTFDIYLGRIDVTSNQADDGYFIGGEQDEHASALASGYLGLNNSSDYLYLTGAFSDQIIFDHPTLGLQTISATGASDGFACRMPGFDIHHHEAVIIQGPHDDKALAITDDGKYVGGFISEGGDFVGSGVPPFSPTTVSANTPCPGYRPGNWKEFGFIAMPDYAAQSWTTVVEVFEKATDSQVMSMASGVCGEFYAVLNDGLHPFRITVPYLNYTHGCLMGNGSCHSYYSTMMKYRDNGTTATQLWQHSFWPATPPTAGSPVVATRYIEDIEVALGDNKQYLYEDVLKETDLVFTGRFGENMQAPNPAGGSFLFDGNWTGPYMHSQVGMFVMGMQELPRFDEDTIELCISDSLVQLPITLDPIWWTGPNPLVDPTSIGYIGNGVVSPPSMLYNPPSVGLHHLIGLFSYLGCDFEGYALSVDVTEDPYPRQPFSNTGDWAEGLAANGASYDQLIAAGAQAWSNNYNYEYNYLAGQFDGNIAFEREDGSVITFNSNTGTDGYVVAYGPCGAVWAIHIEGLVGDDFIEDLKIGLNASGNLPGFPGAPVERLYAAGTVGGNFLLDHSEGANVPLSSLNPSTSPMTLSTFGTTEKGIVMEIDLVTGEVYGVYLGGDLAGQANRFHDIITRDGNFAVAGEYTGTFDVANSSILSSPSVNGSYDPFVVVGGLSGNIDAKNVSSTGIGQFGGDADDHGDAIDMQWKSIELEIILGGHLEQSTGATITTPFTANKPTSPSVPTGNDNDVFLANYGWNPATNAFSYKSLKVYDGAGNDELRDVALCDFNQGAVFQSNQVFFCGRFSDDLTHDFGTMSTTSGSNDFDAFIGSTDLFFTDNWFSHEGHGATFSEESCNGLAIQNNRVFAYGVMDGVNTISDYWISGTPAPASFLAGFGTPLYHDLYTLSFQPNGALTIVEFALPQGSGMNSGNDIENTVNELVVSGDMKISPVGTAIEFMEGSFMVHFTLFQNSTISDAFIGRVSTTGLEYYKNSETDHITESEPDNTIQLSPNPTNGSIELQSLTELTGEIRIYNSIGGLVNKLAVEESMTIRLALPTVAGVYFIQVDCMEYVGALKAIVK
jgi:hypothetical protein